MKEISAGGIVYRNTEDSRYEIQLIKDRWNRVTFPKGKQEAKETLEQTACREIKEETGVVGRVVMPLHPICYHYQHERYGNVEKEVYYFLVQAVGGKDKVQQEEIIDVSWHYPQEALHLQKNDGYANQSKVFQQALRKLLTVPHG